MPVKQTVPWTAVARRVSRSVGAPTSSTAPDTPSGTMRRTASAMAPSSMTTWSTPAASRTWALAALLVVEIIVRPRCLAITARARPIEEVPPRMSRLSPGCASTPVVREP
jgi:hypothetical protein